MSDSDNERITEALVSSRYDTGGQQERSGNYRLSGAATGIRHVSLDEIPPDQVGRTNEILRKAASETHRNAETPSAIELSSSRASSPSVGSPGNVGGKGRVRYVRANKCHDFKWSRTLWGEASAKTEKLIMVLVAVYIGATCAIAWTDDGLKGWNLAYWLAATVTTVGFGDISPQGEIHRASSIVLLPAGLVLIGFAISLVQTRALAAAPKKVVAATTNDGDGADEPRGVPGRQCWSLARKRPKTWGLVSKVAKLMFRYMVVVVAGAAFFFFYEPERDAQAKNAGQDMTVVDCLFLATVMASTVGYGHELWAQSVGAKAFCVVYMLVATTLVASILGDLAGAYLDFKAEQINYAIIDSVIWVHKADLIKSGIISQTDFVLFKLQQLQKVDSLTLSRLHTRFSRLDVHNQGYLEIGTHVPSAKQVERLQEEIAGSKRTLMSAWLEMQAGLTEASADPEASLQNITSHASDFTPSRVVDCHNFGWSRSLWAKAARDAGRIALCLLAAFVGLGVCLAYTCGYSPALAWYFIAATLSTVGFGDVAPENQTGRAIAIVFIPIGLITLSLLFSFIVARGRSKPFKPAYDDPATAASLERLRAVFDAIDMNHDQRLELSEVVAGAEKLGISSPAAAAQLFRQLDKENKGWLDSPPAPEPRPWSDTAFGAACLLTAKLYCTIAVGAVLIKLLPGENGGDGGDLTWIDAVYYGTVVSTAIGYGDIVPVTWLGRLVFSFYFLAATITVGGVLGGAVGVYVDKVLGEDITAKIIDSTVWVHKADIRKQGRVTESDYVLFKLQQMQKVDAEMLDRLIDRFEEVDVNFDGYMSVGVEVPSAEHVQRLQEHVSLHGGTLMDAWSAMKDKV